MTFIVNAYQNASLLSLLSSFLLSRLCASARLSKGKEGIPLFTEDRQKDLFAQSTFNQRDKCRR